MAILHYFLAQLMGFAILQFIPKSLNASTTIIGYPIHANFNIDYYYAFYLIQLCIVAPLSLMLYHRSCRNNPSSNLAATDTVSVGSKFIYYLLAPLLILYVFSHSAVPRSWIHLYHDAESMLSSQFLQRGLIPWRDFVFTHGLLQDPLMALLGHKLFGNTVWGADQGVALLWVPLFHLSWYFLFLKLYSKHKTFLWLIVFILPFFFPMFFNRFNLRFLFFPLLLVASSTFFEKNSRLSAFLLGAFLIGCIFLTPELVLYALCLGFCLVGFAWKKNKDFSKVLWFALGGGILCLFLGSALQLMDALIPFLKVYTEEGLHYRYESGIPLTLNMGGWFLGAFSIPVACFFIGNFYFYGRFRAENALSGFDWMLLSYHLFSILYFSKLLCRADSHVLAHSGIAIPLLIYFIFEIKWMKRRWIQVGAFGLILFGFYSVGPHLSPQKFKMDQTVQNSRWTKFGLHQDNRVSNEIISDLDSLFKASLAPEEPIFDFTNEPLLFHYLLDRMPATRFPYVIMAATRETQERLINDLEKTRPKLVVYASQLDYASWDGVPASVRHYEVSRYLLKNYKKLHSFKHHLILQRNDLDLEFRESPNSEFKIEACDWGYAPNYLTEFLSADERTLAFKTEKLEGGYVTEISLPDLARNRDSILEMEFGSTSTDAFSFYGRNEALGIHFKTLDKQHHKLAVPLASCPQWWSYQGNILKLVYSQPQKIVAIKLRNLRFTPSGETIAKLSDF